MIELQSLEVRGDLPEEANGSATLALQSLQGGLRSLPLPLLRVLVVQSGGKQQLMAAATAAATAAAAGLLCWSS